MGSGEPAASPGLDPDDPYAREAQTFAKMPPEMAARVARYGVEENLPARTTFFTRGERSVDFLNPGEA